MTGDESRYEHFKNLWQSDGFTAIISVYPRQDLVINDTCIKLISPDCLPHNRTTETKKSGVAYITNPFLTAFASKEILPLRNNSRNNSPE
ncbi:MAG: hypothetical protein EOL87_16460 [Spartobacteria bacterium]|nr:hypothetical protein [Spartobacteria bacterium]